MKSNIFIPKKIKVGFQEFNKKFKHQYINDNRFVSIYLDKEQNRIGFLFTQSPEKFSMKLILTKDDNCLLHGNVILKNEC